MSHLWNQEKYEDEADKDARIEKEKDDYGKAERANIERGTHLVDGRNTAMNLVKYLKSGEERLSFLLVANETMKERLLRARATSLTAMHALGNPHMLYYAFFQWKGMAHEAQLRHQRHNVKLSIRVEREHLVKRIVDLEEKIRDATQLGHNLEGELAACKDVIQTKKKEVGKLETDQKAITAKSDRQDRFMHQLAGVIRSGVNSLDADEDTEVEVYKQSEAKTKLDDSVAHAHRILDAVRSGNAA